MPADEQSVLAEHFDHQLFGGVINYNLAVKLIYCECSKFVWPNITGDIYIVSFFVGDYRCIKTSDGCLEAASIDGQMENSLLYWLISCFLALYL